MLSDAKVATPATAATDAVPPSVPPPGLLPIASVTLPANPVATLPNVSHAVTSTAGVMVAAAAVLVGCTVRSEEHTSELQSQSNLVCRLLLEKKKKKTYTLDRMMRSMD